jgi:hypothetical protein
MQDEEADRLSESTREFAQAILGRPVPSRNPEVIAREKLAQLEWLATFSPRHEEELRRLRREEAKAREKQEHLAWLASISAVNEAEWDPAKHPRGGFSQNRGWFSQTSGAGDGDAAGPSFSFGGRKAPSTGVVLQRNRAIADLTGTMTPGMVRSRRLALDIKSALELPGQVARAFVSGAGTGGKAVVNGSATAVKNVATLGLSTSQLELIGVTKEDRDNGYDTAVSIATASGEVLITVGTGGIASALAKGGTIARNAGGVLVAYDAAGNAVGVVQGTYDAAKNGVNLQNGAAVAAGALGLSANIKTAKNWNLFVKPSVKGTPQLPAGEGRTDKFGNVIYSTLGTEDDIALARFHESVHSLLSPKLAFFREFRANMGQAAYEKSSLVQYLEETLAETYAQLRVRGFAGLPTGITFPIREGYVTVSEVVKEGAIATIVVGGITYGVYYAADRMEPNDDGN